MFGKNPVRKQDLREDGHLAVQEVFMTIQGEGPYTGIPAVFVRLWGCNLRCWFCDTDFESTQQWYSPEALCNAVIDAAEQCAASMVVLTGGEPLRQNVVPFINALNACSEEHPVFTQVETAGTLWVSQLEQLINDRLVDLVCSPKTPGVHPMIEKHCEHYKYIISARDLINDQGIPYATTQNRPRFDGTDATEIKPLFRPADWRAGETRRTIWLQPCYEYIDGERENRTVNEANQRRVVQLAMKHGYRVSLQTHKILGLR